MEGDPELRQLFSTYPYGSAGWGLLLLRTAVGVTGIVDGLSIITGLQGSAWEWAGGLLALSGALAVIGLFTSFAGIAAALSAAMLTLSIVPRYPALSLLDRPLGAGIFIALSLATALLGPGAFSTDFRLFGRREIIIPRGDPPPASR